MPILTQTFDAGGYEKAHIPPGTYSAKLTSIVPFPLPDKKDPSKTNGMLRWSFDVMSKTTQEIKTIEGVTSTKWNAGTPGFPTPRAWVWAHTLLGKDPALVDFDTDDLIGIECTIKVIDRQDKSGATVSGVVDIVPPAGEF